MTLKIGYEPIKGDPEDDSCDQSDNEDTQDEEEFSNPEVYTENALILIGADLASMLTLHNNLHVPSLRTFVRLM